MVIAKFIFIGVSIEHQRIFTKNLTAVVNKESRQFRHLEKQTCDLEDFMKAGQSLDVKVV